MIHNLPPSSSRVTRYCHTSYSTNVGIIYIVFAKALSKVDYSVLCHKRVYVSHANYRFLIDRSKFIRFPGDFSSVRSVVGGTL